MAAGIAAASIRHPPERRVLPLASSADHSVTPVELAGWIIEGRRDFTVVDLRSRSEFQAGNIRGAVSCSSCHQDRDEGRRAQAGEAFVDLSKKVVLYTQTGGEPVLVPKVLHDNPRVLFLTGGYEGWRRDVLAPVDLAAARTDEDLAAARKRAAVRSFFTGEAASSDRPTATLPLEPVRRIGAHKAGTASEGC
jgi:rhodanese-related sulfurtransferase